MILGILPFTLIRFSDGSHHEPVRGCSTLVRQIASSEEGVRQAAKANEIMQKSFEIGAASYLNLRDAELANTSAQLAYLQAIYNYLVSTSELDTLLGREDALGISRYNTAK